MLHSLYTWFWDVGHWLPEGYTWEDTKSTAEITRPQIRELYITPFVGICFLILRYLFEKYIALSLCKSLGIKNAQTVIVPSKECEEVFVKCSNPDQAKLRELTKLTGWTSQTVSRWFRRRRKSRITPMLNKATEAAWRCFVYFFLFVYGTYVLVRTDWFWDSYLIMDGYIQTQSFNIGLRWYYYLELGFYLQLCVTQMSDTKRKDFWQQYVHHVITILLMSGSYVICHFRFGTLIMIVHDASDYWLEAAKVFNYGKKEKLSEACFIIFAITFYLTRWLYFPIYIMYTFAVENSRICGKLTSLLAFPYFMLYLCIILFTLHIYWGLLIARMIYKFTLAGKIEKDARSDDEDDNDSDGNSD